jgi:NOL1/NOP2/sun family putative RNA methylase
MSGGEAEAIFPEAFAARIEELLGDEARALLAALAAPPQGLRVNTLRLTPERFREISPLDLRPLAFPPAGFVVEGDARPGRHPHHAAGLYYLQDPGAMAVGALVAPRPGQRVLDLAAAPGGKATHLAALMEDRGLLVANDVHAGRARELAGNLERIGATNAVVTNETAGRLAERLGAAFDRVLLDAPCSGESMFSKSEAARREWSRDAVLGCARRQGDLLDEAARLVRPGGLLVYSTCTFSPEEDEGAVAGFIERHPEFEVVELTAVPGGSPGRTEWVGHGAGARPELSRTLRLWPHRAEGAGHFVAGLRRSGAGEESRWPADGAAQAPGEAARLLADFLRRSLGMEPPEGALVLRGSELFCLPEGAPPLGGLRVTRPGWWLGTVHRDRFEPAHALAMAPAASRAPDALDLRSNDPAVAAYLRGEPLRAAGRPGWVAVRVDGFPLGWGKRVGETVKNHYPKGLRRR